MTIQDPRPLKSTIVAVALLALGAIVWWKVAQQPTSSSAQQTANVSPRSGTPPPTKTVDEKQEASAPIDELRAAHITFAGGTHVLAPNARGEFPRLIVPASATITATVPFAAAEAGEAIPVQAEDGGLLQGTAAQGNVTVDTEHKVSVAYQVSANDGLHRVTLRHGGESRVLEFWVGAEPPVLVRK